MNCSTKQCKKPEKEAIYSDHQSPRKGNWDPGRPRDLYSWKKVGVGIGTQGPPARTPAHPFHAYTWDSAVVISQQGPERRQASVVLNLGDAWVPMKTW